MDAIELAYLAGLFDGEGCVGIRRMRPRGYHVLYIAVANTNRDVLRLFERFGGDVHRVCKPVKPTHRICYTWRASAQTAEAVLRLLLPFLRVKRFQAELALEFRALGKFQGGSPATKRIPVEVVDARERFRVRLQEAKR